MALNVLDNTGLAYLWLKIKDKFVAKESGKGLSTNDYTAEEKTKLAGLSNYTLPTATDQVLGGVKVGAGLAINNGVLSATDGGTADSVDWSGVQNKPNDITNISSLLAGKIASSEKGANSGVAPLGADGLIPTQYIAGAYEDIVDGYYDSTLDKFYTTAAKTTELEKVTGRVYVDLTSASNPIQYRYSGSTFVQIAAAVTAIDTNTIDTIVAS